MAIVGGGIVGLASANAIAGRGLSTCLIERHSRLGPEASTHNSGVIHAGIYYPAGSLKARLCVEGRDRLYAFCAQHDIPHARTGKLIVAGDEDHIPKLEALRVRGHANGVTDLELVDRDFIRRREPHVESPAALWSPSTGIIEAEAFVRVLTRMARSRDVAFLTQTAVTGGDVVAGGIEVRTPRESFVARTVINAAGLRADELSSLLGGESFTIYPVRGDYAELTPAARHLVNGPVYPLPDPGGHGLGVHLTRTTWGSVTLGPTARYQSSKTDYESDRVSLREFHESVRPFLPEIRLDHLRPGGSGIRATSSPPNQTFADFRIGHDSRVPGLIQAAGIDSPGLTASLAIAEVVADLVRESLR